MVVPFVAENVIIILMHAKTCDCKNSGEHERYCEGLFDENCLDNVKTIASHCHSTLSSAARSLVYIDNDLETIIDSKILELRTIKEKIKTGKKIFAEIFD